MAENNIVNLFSLSYDVINGMNKKDLVDNIENSKGKVERIQGLFNQSSKLSKNIDRLVTANKKLNSEFAVCPKCRSNPSKQNYKS